MGQVFAFKHGRKAREETLSPTMVTCLNLEEQCSDEIRAKFDLWVVELTAVIAHLENLLGTLNARIEILPGSQGKLDLENLRAEIVIEIDTARRYLAEI